MSRQPSDSAATASPDGSVEYDGIPLVEVALGDLDYRLDVGKQGTALAISTRPTGTWSWQFVGEARWDGSSLRCRAVERPVLEQLARALSEAMAEAS